MHAAIAKLLATQGVVILDGAQGTELERRGVDLAGSRLWSAQLLIDNPDLVREITLDYLRAGSGERRSAGHLQDSCNTLMHIASSSLFVLSHRACACD